MYKRIEILKLKIEPFKKKPLVDFICKNCNATRQRKEYTTTRRYCDRACYLEHLEEKREMIRAGNMV